MQAVVARNTPPTVFQRGGLLTRLRVRPDSGAPFLEPLGEAALRGVLARVATWVKVERTKGGDADVSAPPPRDVVNDLASLPDWEQIPIINAVVECPVFAAGGELVSEPGYHPEARLWYHAMTGFTIPPVPGQPTAEDIARARSLLLDDLLGDFPFQGQASRANALAALLLPSVRQMIEGPTPLHLFDAPSPGTGKTLLTDVIAIPATGREVDAVTEGRGEEEWRKRILSALAEGPTFLLLDNLKRTLDSAALASALTARVFKDRLLGFSKMAALPVTCAWLATGNNTELSHEMTRRTVLIRIDARTDQPWNRRGFRHPRLLDWAKAHRGELIWAALTLCRAWIAAGRPPGQKTLGMYESWVETIGGILDVAGVPGLLENADELLREADRELPQWRAFMAAWWKAHGEAPVGTAALFDLATTQELLPDVLSAKGRSTKDDPHSQRTRLGRALGRKRDYVCGPYRIESAGEDNSGRQLYRLRMLEAAAPATQGGGADHGSGGESAEWSA
jgi:hypothetical protein